MQVLSSIKTGALISLGLLVGCAALDQRSAAPPYSHLKDQFTIDLPQGWTAYNQEEAMAQILSGKSQPVKPSRFGMVFFAKNIAEMPLMDQMRAVDQMSTGKLPSFFVERVPAKKNMTCNRFPETAKQEVMKVIKRSVKDQRFVKELQARAISIGGCEGFRIRGETETPDGTNWVHDVHVVSDGTVLYLFALRNIREYFQKNFGVYENAIGTVRLTSAF